MRTGIPLVSGFTQCKCDNTGSLQVEVTGPDAVNSAVPDLGTTSGLLGMSVAGLTMISRKSRRKLEVFIAWHKRTAFQPFRAGTLVAVSELHAQYLSESILAAEPDAGRLEHPAVERLAAWLPPVHREAINGGRGQNSIEKVFVLDAGSPKSNQDTPRIGTLALAKKKMRQTHL